MQTEGSYKGMIITPRNGAVLCQMTNSTEHEDSSFGFVYRKEELPIYEVLAVDSLNNRLGLSIGDLVVCNSTGTKLKLDDGVQYLFNAENIIGKVSER